MSYRCTLSARFILEMLEKSATEIVRDNFPGFYPIQDRDPSIHHDWFTSFEPSAKSQHWHTRKATGSTAVHRYLDVWHLAAESLQSVTAVTQFVRTPWDATGH